MWNIACLIYLTYQPLKEVKYIATRDEYKESFITDAAVRKMYDKLLYDITLRTLHELFEADALNAIDSIVFNGWVLL